jgi:TolB-like protein/Flp pilus assembly protein TadD
MSNDPSRAVFLSYASQDAEAVRRIAEALRASGVEVWFDQNELVGGDAWDQKIRGQIKSCALFVPVISAATQARREGYFRLEWKLAAQRTHTMADGTPFLLPVVIDATKDGEALVPEEFRAVQWTRLPGGVGAEKFCARVGRLLGGEGEAVGPVGDRAPEHRSGLQGKRSPARRWLGPAVLGVVAVGALAVWQPWRRGAANSAAPAAQRAPDSDVTAELARVRARIVPERWQQTDFEAVASTLDRLIQANPEEADAWALRSITNSLQVLRVLDSGTKPLEAGKTAANRALRLAPDRPLANLAMGLHLTAMVSRGGDPRAGRELVDQALPGLSVDALTRYAGVASVWMGYDFAEATRRARAYLEAEPSASYPAWILGLAAFATRRADEAADWCERAAAAEGVTVVRTLGTLADVNYYLRSDLVAARAVLERLPARYRFVHRVVYARWLMTTAEEHWDQALQDLAQLPDAFLSDTSFSGPKALLAGITHRRAGRTEAALVQFREAERLVRERLTGDSENEELRAILALTLAYGGRPAEARNELALIEPLVRTRAANVHRFKVVMPIAQTYGVIGDFPAMAVWLRMQFAEPSQAPLTPASFRYDVRFAGTAEAAEIKALLKEFAGLDQKPKDLTKADAASDKSVAVLAFANLADDKANEYFCDGISEELLNVLAKVQGLKVTARTSAFHFKGKDTPIPEIAKQLGVAYVVEGSVRKAGDKVRITAQLIKAADGFHVWSDTFTRDLKDVFAVQDEIAGIIAKQLSLKLGASSAAAMAGVSPEALELYVQGRQAWNLRTSAGFSRAEELLNRALVLSPSFARAHAALADVGNTRGQLTGELGAFGRRNSALQQRVFAQIQRALDLDGDCAEAHAALGVAAWNSWEIPKAERALRRAIELNPNYASAHQWLGRVLAAQGKVEEALPALKRATELDPFAARIFDNYAMQLAHAGQLAEARAVCTRGLEIQPGAAVLSSFQASILRRLGAPAAADAFLRAIQENKEGGSVWLQTWLLALGGWPKEAAVYLPGVKPQIDDVALILAHLGRTDDALAALNPETVQVTMLDQWLYQPAVDPLRGDPRFGKFLATLGASEAHARAQAWRAKQNATSVEPKK